ncbi:3-hydroxyacyl-CoA dehydrogenase NAD-binding domain-containing protein [Bdellovibrionota bacterium FG-1]
MSETIHYEKSQENIVTLTMDMPNSSANIMNGAFIEAFEAILQRLEREKNEIAGVILTSAKATFFAGGDLSELIEVRPEQAELFFKHVEHLKGMLRRLESWGKPVVAAINGAALGGGWELALACHHRICLDHSSIQLGMPEVTLGLLPGAGGVIRTVRLLGLQEAFPYLVEGKKIRPQEALEKGLVHELAKDPVEMMAKASAWILAHLQAKAPWDNPEYKIPGGTPSNPQVAQMLMVAPAMLREKTRGCYPAPEAILAVMAEGAQVDFDTALRIESRAFVNLATSQVSKNMIGTMWFQLNKIHAGASRPDGYPQWKANQVAVLGAGMMGAGIAYACATRGIRVVLKDVSSESAERGKSYTEKLLAKKVSRGQMTEAKKSDILGLIRPTADAKDLAGCDLMIEAVFENRELKFKVIGEAEPYLAPNALLSSNTSTLPITGLAPATKTPERFIGLHFFSPVDKMDLVEIIVGKKTSDETIARAFDFVMQIGKTPIVVNDSRGFFTSRVFTTYVFEGMAMLAEGLTPSAIETAALMGGMPVGPLAVTDEVSISLCAHIMAQTRADFEAEGKKYVPHPAEDTVIRRMISEFKRPGKAAGGGFYEYPKDGKKFLWPNLQTHYVQKDRQIPLEDMRDRLLFIQALETVRILEEGVLRTVRDGNVGSILGLGFAPWSGGALQYINQYGQDGKSGLKRFAARAHELATRYGERFASPALLLKKAESGEIFE